MAAVKKYFKFYDKGKLVTFKVNNLQDAYKAMARLKISSGWYVEKDNYGGVVESVRIFS
jgi:hypothetical protein